MPNSTRVSTPAPLKRDMPCSRNIEPQANTKADNATIESFFGHFKDNVDVKQATSLDELKGLVDEYMEYYNGTRKQWNLKKMTPAQYRSHLIAA